MHDVSGIVVVHHDLERYLELLAIMQGRSVVIGDAPGSVVEVDAIVKFTTLHVTAQFGELEPAPRRLTASPRKWPGLYDLAVISELAQFERGRHARKTGTNDDDLCAGGAAVKGRRIVPRGRDANTPRVHSGQEHRRSASRSQILKKGPAIQAARTVAAGGAARAVSIWGLFVGHAEVVRPFQKLILRSPW